MVVISDLHVDFYYTEGTKVVNCGHILCCRSDSGLAGPDEEKAGPWGNAYCDIPPNLLNTTLDFVKNDLNPDVVFWLGDTQPHDLDTLSPEEVKLTMIKTSEIIQDRLAGVQVYPVLGNHDSAPGN